MKLFLSLFIVFSVQQAGVFAQTNLYIPPVLNGPVYNLTMQNGTHQFFPGINSATKGFNGNILGPTLIMQAGEEVFLNVKNSIGEETTVHWHGFHVAPENDGGPHTVIDPNTTWTPHFTVLDKAATYWYHPHLHKSTARQIIQGLAGLIIVKDAVEAALTLPRTYGVDDFPLIIQTKAIAANGDIKFAPPGLNQDTMVLVNATRNGMLDVPRQMVRFRILNGSNHRVFNLGLSNNGTFYHIATDGGLKATRTSLTRLRLAPGERGEIVVPFGSYAINTNIQLKSYANELPDGIWGATRAWINHSTLNPTGYDVGNTTINGKSFTLLKFKVVAATANAVISIPPLTLATVTPIPESQSEATRSKWLFSGAGPGFGVQIGSTSNYANATNFDMNVINDVIPLGKTEIWKLTGADDQFHPFHIHDVQFYILDRKDSNGINIPLTSNETGRKDVVFVGPKETVRFITKFEDFWGDVPYMYHCHITVHEDLGMMKQYTVNKVFYVDKNYTGSTETGSSFFPFKKLLSAVNAAIEGSTIYFVQPGLHEEVSTSSMIIKKKIIIKPLGGSITIQ